MESLRDQSGATPTARFEHRLGNLHAQLYDIQADLAQHPFVEPAHRTITMLREIRALLDTNVNVLFSAQPMDARHDLHALLDAADNQIRLALHEEFEYASMRRRLSVAASLAEYVLRTMTEAIEELKQKKLL